MIDTIRWEMPESIAPRTVAPDLLNPILLAIEEGKVEEKELLFILLEILKEVKEKENIVFMKKALEIKLNF